MKFGLIWQRLRHSFGNSAGTIVFGMEDGSIGIAAALAGVAISVLIDRLFYV